MPILADLVQVIIGPTPTNTLIPPPVLTAVEMDRPARQARRHGAMSDALDAVRAGREVLGRDRLAQPRAGGRRAALGALLAARRSALDAATCAQQQLQAMVVTAPPRLRAQLGGRSTRQLITACARLRGRPSWEVERRTTALVLASSTGPLN